MNTHIATRLSTATLTLAPLLLVAACGAARPVAAGPLAPSTATAAPSPRPAQVALAETSGTVAISDEIRKACGIADEDAYFAFDSSTVLSTDIRPLDAVAKCFSVGPLKGRDLRLVGHADPRGPVEYNMSLGQRRADSVEQYLQRHGVVQARTASTSRGALDATGSDEAGWAHDRRVDVALGT
jgi:peptidoglycan-associated lipoprotein